MPQFETLSGGKKTKVLIIGGGLTGILCAYYLKQAGVDYILCEADRIANGVTRNTTAKITSQHSLIYQTLSQHKRKLYLEANEDALNEYKNLCKNIDCDFEEKPSYVYSLRGRRRIEAEIKALMQIGYTAEFTNNIPLPIRIDGAVVFKNQAQFNPLKFISAIAENLNIYENTKITELRDNVAISERSIIHAEKIIVATHFPFINKHGSYFLKMYQHRSYVIALKNADNVDGMFVDESDTGLSFRDYKDWLLIGGGSHRTGKDGGNWTELEEFAKKHYPKASIDFRFATQDCMTLDSVPYIGQYSKNTPSLFVATGFNKWGMTSSMVAAKLLTDLITEKENKYASLFNPSRSIIHPQLFANAGHSVINLLTPTSPRCPHLGCALKWNKDEHSWDCPCHGSRFSDSGELLDNPATDDL